MYGEHTRGALPIQDMPHCGPSSGRMVLTARMECLLQPCSRVRYSNGQTAIVWMRLVKRREVIQTLFLPVGATVCLKRLRRWMILIAYGRQADGSLLTERLKAVRMSLGASQP